MEASPNIKTYSGRSIEALLPQIRTELGDDAVVVRCREGLSGGIGGFFQRPCVEIDAAARRQVPAAAEAPDPPEFEVRNDRATAEGLAAAAVRTLLEQAAPFADQLRDARRQQAEHGEPVEPRPQLLDAVGIADPGLYGPQPMAQRERAPAEPADERSGEPFMLNAPQSAPASSDAFMPADELASGPPTSPFDPPSSPAAPAQPDSAACALPAAGRTAERRLVQSGLDSAFAADVVGEAVAHGVPFGSARGMKKLVRGVLAQRLRVLGHRGPGPVTLAVTGPAGAGSSTAVGHLAAAYARANAMPIVVIALRSTDAGEALRGRLSAFGVHVEAASDGTQARRIVAANPGAVIFVDAPAVTLAEKAGCAQLARDLSALAPDELHLALPATLSAAAAEELAELLDPVGLTHIALTRMDETRRPGAGLGFCLASGRPLSYLCVRDAVAPADAATVAQLLLP